MVKSENIKIQLSDITGRKMKVIFSGVLNSGRHELKLDISDLLDGIYFCSIKSSDMSQTLKLIKK